MCLRAGVVVVACMTAAVAMIMIVTGSTGRRKALNAQAIFVDNRPAPPCRYGQQAGYNQR